MSRERPLSFVAANKQTSKQTTKESGPFFFESPFLGAEEFNLVILIVTVFLLEWSAVNDIRLTKSSGGGKKEGEEGKKNIP